MLRSFAVAVFLVSFLMPLNATGAHLANLQLVPDGSATPPGDKVLITVLLEAGEKRLELEVRPFVLAADDKDNAKASALKTTDPR